jgi:phage FluMu protein Com
MISFTLMLKLAFTETLHLYDKKCVFCKEILQVVETQTRDYLKKHARFKLRKLQHCVVKNTPSFQFIELKSHVMVINYQNDL